MNLTKQNRRVITLTEPQVWTLIGVFSATIFGIITFGFAGIRNEMKSLRSELISVMTTGFNAVEKRIEYLERDVQFLMRKEFGDSPNQ